MPLGRSEQKPDCRRGHRCRGAKAGGAFLARLAKPSTRERRNMAVRGLGFRFCACCSSSQRDTVANSLVAGGTPFGLQSKRLLCNIVLFRRPAPTPCLCLLSPGYGYVIIAGVSMQPCCRLVWVTSVDIGAQGLGFTFRLTLVQREGVASGPTSACPVCCLQRW